MLNLGRGQEEKREEMRIAVNDKCDMIGYILKEKKNCQSRMKQNHQPFTLFLRGWHISYI